MQAKRIWMHPGTRKPRQFLQASPHAFALKLSPLEVEGTNAA